MDRENVRYMCNWYTYIIEYYSALKNEGNPIICNNMDEPWGYFDKWNKSDRERQIPHGIT